MFDYFFYFSLNDKYCLFVVCMQNFKNFKILDDDMLYILEAYNISFLSHFLLQT